MRVTLIAEGSTRTQRAKLRWGVAFRIKDVFFDAFGREDIFWRNIARFKINPSGIRHFVISHDDWDHRAALAGFLEKNPGTKIYLCKKAGGDLKELVRSRRGLLVEVDSSRRIGPGIYSLGQLRADTGRGILFEQALVLKSRNGFSVITGCAHPGILRILKRTQKVFGKKLYAVAGGFHMKNNLPGENEKIVKALLKLGVKKVAPVHCTGAGAVRVFKKFYGKNCLRFREGDTLEL